MKKSSVEKLSSSIGFEIGMSDDIVQADLLIGFCRGLNNSILNKSARDTQICAIVDRLDDKAEKIILELSEFIKLKQGI